MNVAHDTTSSLDLIKGLWFRVLKSKESVMKGDKRLEGFQFDTQNLSRNR